MASIGESAKRRFWRRVGAGAGWAAVLLIGIALLVAGWFWYELSGGFTSNVWPTVGYALLTAGVLSLYVAPVFLLLGAVCGAAWDWVAR
jgi:hypothetical protein